VAIDSFSDNLRDSVRQQSRALLGADLSLASRQPLSKTMESVIDSFSRGGEQSRITSFAGMAYVTRTEGSRLVQVAAVSGRYPLYGEIRTAPRAAWQELQAGRRVVVDPSLLTAFNARLGDTLALGEARFVITGTIVSAPSEVGFRFALGPRVYIPAAYLQDTRLLGFGARAQYEVFFKIPPKESAQALADKYRSALRSQRVSVRTVADDQRNLTDVLSRLTGYLGLVALVALLLAGIGVASAVVVLVRQRTESVAVLRCLGATANQIIAIYLLEASITGLIGSTAGAIIGVAVQRSLPVVLSGLLPLDVTVQTSWNAVLLGLLSGLWVSAVFAVLPLLIIRSISPLGALRRRYEPVRAPRDILWTGAVLAVAFSVVVLAARQVDSWKQGAVFSAGIGVTLLLLWILSGALMRLLRRRIPAVWPYVWRQGLANLHRPSNQTVMLVLAVGFGTFLLATLFLVQHNLLSQLRLTGGPQRPNLVLFDIQPDQLPGVEHDLRARGLPEQSPTPIVTMRISSVKGRSISQLLATGKSAAGEPSNAWALRREYRSTYRDTLVGTERLVAGSWWRSTGAGPAQISLEQDLASELGVGVGDEIVWDVQGVEMPSRVRSLRAVDWARFEPNFFVVFAPGSLERAPQTYVTLTRITNPVERGRFQRVVAERFPNVSILDISLLQEALERLVNRVTLALRFMALFSVAVGILVMTGALAATRLQRLREAALLRTLGASRAQIFRIALTEYVSVGLLAAVTALVLGTLAAWAVARLLFKGAFSLPPGPTTAIAASVVALTAFVGLLNSRAAVRRTPLEVLREE
jgi:putative ABC transport system permease protein